MKQKHPLLCTPGVSERENVPLEEYQVLSACVLKAIFPPAQVTIETVIRVIDNSFKHLQCALYFYTTFHLSFLFLENCNQAVKILPGQKVFKDTEFLEFS